jgi:hypothetical protein
MNRISCYLFTLLFVISVSAQQKEALIRIVQDDAVFLTSFQTTVKLKKKQFRFQVALRDCDGVYVFASIRDSVYRFGEFNAIRDFEYLKLLELREEDIFNSNRELNISETGWSYWFYKKNADWWSFNKKVTYIDTNMALCTKWVRQLYDAEDRRVVKLRDVNTPLYIFFVAVAEYDENGRPVRELMRRKVKIEWEGDDDDD